MTLNALHAELPLATAIHLGAAVSALVLGPFALWSVKGSPLHRGAGRLWVLLMAAAAVSALFIRSTNLPNFHGFSPIHLLILSTAYGLGRGLLEVRRGRIAAHRRSMRLTYVAGCVVAGAFTLLPGRFLGDLLWRQALGWA